MVNIENVESEELWMVLIACSEMLVKFRNAYPHRPETSALKRFFARIRDNEEVDKDLRKYAKDVLEE